MVLWTWKENDYQTKKNNLSFFKVNILLGYHNCLSVQCIDGACWISLGVLSPVGYSCCPTSHSHRTRGYLHFMLAVPITWTPPPPHPPSRAQMDILPIRELVKALAITKTPLFWLSHWIILETKAKNTPVSRENGNAHEAPYALKMGGGGGGVFPLSAPLGNLILSLPFIQPLISEYFYVLDI